MAVKFYNIRTGEERVAETEPQISALWASSDHSPNITQGQDFGWRLAPKVNNELKIIKQDIYRLTEVARSINKNVDEVNESDILMYLSARVAPDVAPVATAEDYQTEYDEEVRRIGAVMEADMQAKEAKVAAEGGLPGEDTPSTTTETTESLEDLAKRVELEERLAAARATADTTTTTTTEPTTSTTTTKSTTSTTTKK